MESKNLLIINSNKNYIDEIKNYCDLNDLNFDDFIKKCFEEGYNIKKYGLLGKKTEPVIKEVIVEKPVEVIKEIIVENTEKIEELTIKVRELETELSKKPNTIIETIEVPVEVIVEKPVEVIKEVYVTDDTETNKLLFKIQQLENKPPEIVEREIIVEKPFEVIKEVENKERINSLQETIKNMRNDMIKKDDKILQLEKDLLELRKTKEDVKVQFMSSSNLNDNLYR